MDVIGAGPAQVDLLVDGIPIYGLVQGFSYVNVFQGQARSVNIGKLFHISCSAVVSLSIP